MGDLARFLRSDRAVVAVGSLGALLLVLGDWAHYAALQPEFSLNLILAAAFMLGASIVVIAQRNFRLLMTTSLAIMAALVILSWLDGIGLRHTQYLLTIACLAGGWMLAMTETARVHLHRIYWAAGLISASIYFLDMVTPLEVLGRAHAAVGPLVIAVILAFRPRRSLLAGVTSACAAGIVLASLTVQTSRMATALSLLVLVAYIALFARIRVPWRVAIVLGALASETWFWLRDPWAHDRLFGHDASVSLGPITINGEGRTGAAQIASAATGGSPEPGPGPLHLLLGNGVGTSGQRLVDAGYVLDKPHNEFIRLFVDAGIVGAALWIAALGAMVVMVWRLARVTGTSARTFIAFSIPVTLLGFSLSDNVLSYAWVMAPSGVLLAWARLGAGSRADSTERQVDGSTDLALAPNRT